MEQRVEIVSADPVWPVLIGTQITTTTPVVVVLC
jgi:hypothetical protein